MARSKAGPEQAGFGHPVSVGDLVVVVLDLTALDSSVLVGFVVVDPVLIDHDDSVLVDLVMSLLAIACLATMLILSTDRPGELPGFGTVSWAVSDLATSHLGLLTPVMIQLVRRTLVTSHVASPAPAKSHLYRMTPGSRHRAQSVARLPLVALLEKADCR